MSLPLLCYTLTLTEQLQQRNSKMNYFEILWYKLYTYLLEHLSPSKLFICSASTRWMSYHRHITHPVITVELPAEIFRKLLHQVVFTLA